MAATPRGTPPDFRGLTSHLIADPAVRESARRMELRADPAFNARFPKERPARVIVTLADGRTVSEERSFRGGDSKSPLSDAQMIQRSRDVLALAPAALDPQPLIDWDVSRKASGQYCPLTQSPTRYVEANGQPAIRRPHLHGN